MNKLFLLLATAFMAVTVLAAEPDTRCFEMRTYHAAPGKLDALNARFRNHTMEIFKRHGMENIGYWVPVDNTNNILIYILAYPSREARDKSWKEFSADPEWQAVAKASEVNGRLVTKVDSVFMKATDFSPLVQLANSAQPRLFELRTYYAEPGKLDNLLARFRNHTAALFDKHGMGQFGCWTPMDKKNGAGEKLIYILAHKDKAVADASWKAFGDDPESQKVEQDSEANGPFPVSVYMVPTDYSPTR